MTNPSGAGSPLATPSEKGKSAKICASADRDRTSGARPRPAIRWRRRSGSWIMRGTLAAPCDRSSDFASPADRRHEKGAACATPFPRRSVKIDYIGEPIDCHDASSSALTRKSRLVSALPNAAAVWFRTSVAGLFERFE